jgi:hypothetical protein
MKIRIRNEIKSKMKIRSKTITLSYHPRRATRAS